MGEEGQATGFSRRDMLKRTLAAGAVVWAVPAVQTLGMTGAGAASGIVPLCHCKVRVEISIPGESAPTTECFVCDVKQPACDCAKVCAGNCGLSAAMPGNCPSPGNCPVVLGLNDLQNCQAVAC